MPSKDTQFKKGQSGNLSGRPKGSTPLSRAKQLILDVFSEHEKEFIQALHEVAHKNPLTYYDSLVAPFMPKELKVEGDLNIPGTGVIAAEALSAIDDLEKRIKQTAKNSAKRARK